MLSASALAGLALPLEGAGATPVRPSAGPAVRLKQSVCRWPYGKIPLTDLARAAAGMGLAAIDLLGSDEWEPVREFGLVCSM
ncbi:MAG TPA: hydroxypyruvate isomerase, partial [Gemmatimonadales bacterium]|nr:hydroxypyruvate isomerase [Gemmatimonadales bacterium]